MNAAQFSKLAEEGYTHIPVFREQLADTKTPVALYAALRAAGHSPTYLLESVQGGERWGRYSIIGLGNGTSLEYRAGAMTVRTLDDVKQIECADPFTFLEDFKAHYNLPDASVLPHLPRFSGGLMGYFGYDCVRYIEPRLNKPPQHDPINLPDLWFCVTDTLIIFDNLRNIMSLVVHVKTTQPQAFEASQHALDRLDSIVNQTGDLTAQPFNAPQFESQTGQAAFMQSIDKIKDYINAGDVMQVVPSQRMTSDFNGDALAVYRALRHINPSPYMFLIEGKTASTLAPFALVGSSPEILSRLEDKNVTVRPLAGTRRRGKNHQEDQELELELLADAKEIAEHVMLIDLGRNDVGRVCETGSVRVTERMSIERYSHVMHIVSNVEGKIRPYLTALDVFKATFPAGTLSGAPKIRAMEIIDELEPVKRGVFGGAVGYLGWHEEMDLAIAIRTGVIHDGKIHVQAGAGVVADSVPLSEWNETLGKARAVMQAVEWAAAGLELENLHKK